METGGYASLTTKQIAQEAGCAEGTLFKYFKRKEELCLAVVLENSPKFREAIAGVQHGKSTVAKNLERIALAAISFFDKLLPLVVALLANMELLTEHRRVMREHGRGPKDVFELIATYIEGEQQLHRIGSRVAPTSAAALLLGPCFHRVLIRQVMGNDLFPSSDRDFVTALAATLLDGLSPSRTKRSRRQ